VRGAAAIGLAAALALIARPAPGQEGAGAPARARTGAETAGSESTGCVRCHEEIGEDLGPQPVEWRVSVHAKVGVSCHDCHGGNPSTDDMLEAKKAEAGYLGKPKSRAEIGPACARCHSDIEYMRRFDPSIRVDQYAEYLTSRHGKALHQEGSAAAATCVDCHGGHAIRSVTDPQSTIHATRVAETCGRCHSDPAKLGKPEIPTDVVEKWRESIHGAKLAAGDLSAPTCNDCHGNHGAVPPGTADVVHVCGRCHSTQEEHFQAGTHRAHFERLEKPACVTCHGNHLIAPATDALLAHAPPGVCGKCHEAGGPCDRATAAMLAGISSLTSGTAEAEAVLDEAERLGMDVSEPRFRLADVRDRVTMARVVVHRFSQPEFDEVVDEGRDVLAEIRADGDAALEEWEFRRRGLGLSLVFIVIVIGLLLRKVRRLDRERAARAPAEAPA
jgi:hypothetical protein